MLRTFYEIDRHIGFRQHANAGGQSTSLSNSENPKVLFSLILAILTKFHSNFQQPYR